MAQPTHRHPVTVRYDMRTPPKREYHTVIWPFIVTTAVLLVAVGLLVLFASHL